MRKVLATVAILAAAGVIYLLFGHGPGGMGPGMPGGPPSVTVAEIQPRDVTEWKEFSGRLVAVESAEVRPQVSGVLQQVHFKEGEWVEKGKPLFTIDPRPYAAALQAAQARSSLADEELARAKKLLAEQAIPQRSYDQRKSDAEAARAALIQAQLNMEYTQVKAPVSGHVGRPEITTGNLVNATNPPLLTVVVSDRPIYADFDIDEQTYLHYLGGAGSDPEKIRAIPVALGLANEEGAPHAGHLQSFDNQMNIRSGTLRARAVLANDDGSLIPGLFARVRLGGAHSGALLVPDHAIGTDQDRKFVIVVKDDNTTERREVKPGGTAEGLRIINEGLQPGEKIITQGLQRVMMPGQPVKPELSPMTDDGGRMTEKKVAP